MFLELWLRPDEPPDEPFCTRPGVEVMVAKPVVEEKTEEDVIVVVMIWPSDEVDRVTKVVCDVELVTRADVIVVLLVLESEDVDESDEVVEAVVSVELVVDEAAALLDVGVVVAEVGGGVLLAPVSLVVVGVLVSVVEP